MIPALGCSTLRGVPSSTLGQALFSSSFFLFFLHYIYLPSPLFDLLLSFLMNFIRNTTIVIGYSLPFDVYFLLTFIVYQVELQYMGSMSIYSSEHYPKPTQ